MEVGLSHETLSLLIRWLHVAGMALALGGALLLWWAAARPGGLGVAPLLGLAHGYERLFWLALGVLVMTGIGNLGAFGAGLRGPDSAWGGRLLVKLAVVLALLCLSAVRTLVVVRLSTPEVTIASPWLPRLYAATSLVLGAITLLGVVLAHAR